MPYQWSNVKWKSEILGSLARNSEFIRYSGTFGSFNTMISFTNIGTATKKIIWTKQY